jgi:hypothetical protein
MIITSETTIDLDEKRKVWVSMTAEGDSEPSAEMVENLAQASVKGALDAYNQGKAQQAQQAQRTFGGGRTPDRPKPIGVED